MKVKALALTLIAMMAMGCKGTENPRSVEDFNFEWRFSLGDSDAFAASGFDDSGWKRNY